MGMNLLVVDDSKIARTEIIKMLNNEKYIGSIFQASNGVETLKVLASERIDLILSDVVMPTMDGYKLLRNLQVNEEWKHIPVILLTEKEQVEDRVRGLDLGAWDYVAKSSNPMEKLSRIRVMLRIKTLQDKLKTRIRQLERLSIVDGLTGLYNKKYLYEFVKRELKRSQRLGLALACIMIDVDHFKKINDDYGHPCADGILRQIGGILNDMTRGYDFAARYGGDEFTVVLPQQTNGSHPEVVAERIREAIERNPFKCMSRSKQSTIHITVSLGVATYSGEDSIDHEGLIDRADEGLYQAKLQGRNRIVSV